jgi:hypothetical protein
MLRDLLNSEKRKIHLKSGRLSSVNHGTKLHASGKTAYQGDDRRLKANEACANHWSSVFGSFLLGTFRTLEDEFTNHGFGILCKKVAQIAGLQIVRPRNESAGR